MKEPLDLYISGKKYNFIYNSFQKSQTLVWNSKTTVFHINIVRDLAERKLIYDSLFDGKSGVFIYKCVK